MIEPPTRQRHLDDITWTFPPSTISWPLEHASPQEFGLVLRPYRKWIIAAYLTAVGTFMGMILLIPDVLGSLMMGASVDWSEIENTSDDLIPRFVAAGIFLGTQALFIWGGGRLRLGAHRRQPGPAAGGKLDFADRRDGTAPPAPAALAAAERFEGATRTLRPA